MSSATRAGGEGPPHGQRLKRGGCTMTTRQWHQFACYYKADLHQTTGYEGATTVLYTYRVQPPETDLVHCKQLRCC